MSNGKNRGSVSSSVSRNSLKYRKDDENEEEDYDEPEKKRQVEDDDDEEENSDQKRTPFSAPVGFDNNRNQSDEEEEGRKDQDADTSQEKKQNEFNIPGEGCFDLYWHGSLKEFYDNSNKNKVEISKGLLQIALKPKGERLEDDVELMTQLMKHDKNNCYQVQVLVLGITNTFNKSFEIVAGDPDLNIVNKTESMKYMCDVPPSKCYHSETTGNNVIVNRQKNVDESNAINNLAANSPVRIFYSSIHFITDNKRVGDGREGYIGLVNDTSFTKHIMGDEPDPTDARGETRIKRLDRIESILKAAKKKSALNTEKVQNMIESLKADPEFEQKDWSFLPRNYVMFAYGENMVNQDKIKKGFINLNAPMKFELYPKNRRENEKQDSWIDTGEVSEFRNDDEDRETETAFLNRRGEVHVKIFMKVVYPHLGFTKIDKRYEKDRKSFADESLKFYNNVIDLARRNSK